VNSFIVGIYTRTSILTDRYDRYEKALLFYCKQQGWGDIKYYRDRVGGKLQQEGFDALERSLKSGSLDTDVLEQLIHQQVDDEQHNRDAFSSLLRDAGRGEIEVMVVHDVGQLGNTRLDILRAVSLMLQTGKRLHIYRIGEIRDNTSLFDSSPIDSPDSFGVVR